jgi:ABC-type Zn uptake system ZnuABC Zn-binding protein ZnuA
MLLTLTLCIGGCTSAPDPWKDAKAGQKKVLTTFAPLYCLTQAVAGDDAYVVCFLSETGPHEADFSPRDALKARGADLFIYNGVGLDSVLVERIGARQQVKTFDVGDTLPKDMLLEGIDEDEHAHDKAHKHGHGGHDHGDHDPHVWLGPPQAIAMASAIADKLAGIDSEHERAYHDRATKLREQLEKLQEDGKAKFKDKKNRKVLSMHDSFGYFAKAFGLEAVGSIQPMPGGEVSAARLAKLAELCKSKDVRVITYEPQYSDAQAKVLEDTLKKGHGLDVRLVEFDPIETAPVAKGSINPAPDYYLQKMRENIDNIAKALP